MMRQGSLVLLCAGLLLAGCSVPTRIVQAVSDPLTDLIASGAPELAWADQPQGGQWTKAVLRSIAERDDVLAARVPADIDVWCPGYETAGLEDRRAFWAGVISMIAKYESGWNPKASGAGGRYIGLMQISTKSARFHGCEAQTAADLSQGDANLECAVTIMAKQVAKDGVVTGAKGKLGIGRDWMPLRKAKKRAAIADWVKGQGYCQ